MRFLLNRNKEEIILQIATLLSQLVEDKTEQPTVVPTEEKQIEMLTIKECCDAIKGLNEYTVRQLVTRGEIPFIRCGKGKRGKILISKTALINYFNCAA